MTNVIFQRCVQSSQVPFNGFLSFHASAANIRAQRHCHCFAFRKRFVHAAAPVLVERGISVPKRPFAHRSGAKCGPRGDGVIQGSALWKYATQGTPLMTYCTRLVKQHMGQFLGFVPSPWNSSVENDNSYRQQLHTVKSQ